MINCECSCHAGANYPGKCHVQYCEACGKGSGTAGNSDTVTRTYASRNIKKLQEYVDEVMKANNPGKCDECGLSKDNYAPKRMWLESSVRVCHAQVFNSRSYIDLYMEGVKNMLDDLADKL